MPIIHRSAIGILAIVLFTLLSYSNTFDVPFQLDDITNIVESPAIKKFDYFTNLSKLEQPGNPDVFEKRLFKSRYVGYLTFAVNHAIHGLDVRGYHLVNLLIHLSSALLLYAVLLFTFSTPIMMESAPSDSMASRQFIALFSALLFAVHPVQTQAVTYIVQRFASMATMLCLLAFFCYQQFRLAPVTNTVTLKRPFLYAASLAASVLAMKTKEFALLLPVIIFLYEVIFFKERLKKTIFLLAPFFLTMAVVPLSVMNAKDRGLGESAARISGIVGEVSRQDYLFTQFRVIVTYIRLLLFPAGQRFEYDYPVYHSFFVPEVLISFLFLAAVLLCGLLLYRRSRSRMAEHSYLYLLISFGIFWFFITTSAESSVIPIADVIFEHRMYLPSIGFFIAVVSAVELFRVKCDSAASSMPVIAVMLLVASALSVATFNRNSLWRNEIAFLENEVKLSPGKARAHYQLGKVYALNGRFEDAIQQLKTAIAINSYLDAHYNLAFVYHSLGRLPEAEQEYMNTIKLRFASVDAHLNLGVVYAQQQRWEEAIREFRTTLLIAPGDRNAAENLGRVLRRQTVD